MRRLATATSAVVIAARRHPRGQSSSATTSGTSAGGAPMTTSSSSTALAAAPAAAPAADAGELRRGAVESVDEQLDETAADSEALLLLTAHRNSLVEQALVLRARLGLEELSKEGVLARARALSAADHDGEDVECTESRKEDALAENEAEEARRAMAEDEAREAAEAVEWQSLLAELSAASRLADCHLADKHLADEGVADDDAGEAKAGEAKAAPRAPGQGEADGDGAQGSKAAAAASETSEELRDEQGGLQRRRAGESHGHVVVETLSEVESKGCGRAGACGGDGSDLVRVDGLVAVEVEGAAGSAALQPADGEPGGQDAKADLENAQSCCACPSEVPGTTQRDGKIMPLARDETAADVSVTTADDDEATAADVTASSPKDGTPMACSHEQETGCCQRDEARRAEVERAQSRCEELSAQIDAAVAEDDFDTADVLQTELKQVAERLLDLRHV